MNYKETLKWFDEKYNRVDPFTFYLNIFGAFKNENLYKNIIPSRKKINNNACAVFSLINNSKDNKSFNKTVFIDFQGDLDLAKSKLLGILDNNKKEHNMCVSSACTYINNRVRNDCVLTINGLIFDLDKIDKLEYLDNLKSLYDGTHKFTNSPDIPRPTYISVSGSGLHFYYLFDKPIYYEKNSNIWQSLQILKDELYYKMIITNFTTSLLDGSSGASELQYQSINHQHRIIGSINNKQNTEIVAYKIGERVTLDYLNKFSATKIKIKKNSRYIPSKKEAEKKKYPKKNNRAPYYHFRDVLIEQVKGGHRFYYMFYLSVMAKKYNVSKRELMRDLSGLFKKLHDIPNGEDELTISDMKAAARGYDDKNAYKYTKTIIEKRVFPGAYVFKNYKTKRNGRTQEEHCALMRDKKRQKNSRKNNNNIYDHTYQQYEKALLTFDDIFYYNNFKKFALLLNAMYTIGAQNLELLREHIQQNIKKNKDLLSLISWNYKELSNVYELSYTYVRKLLKELTLMLFFNEETKSNYTIDKIRKMDNYDLYYILFRNRNIMFNNDRDHALEISNLIEQEYGVDISAVSFVKGFSSVKFLLVLYETN